MLAFQNTWKQIEQKIMVHLLTEIEKNPSFTLRGLASGLAIARGLINQYLKSCVTKERLRTIQVSPHHITCFLTPEGLKKKEWNVSQYLARPLGFFREACKRCEEFLAQCKVQNWLKIDLIGERDFVNIAKLLISDMGIQIKNIIAESNLKFYNVVLIADIIRPQSIYNIKNKIKYPQLLNLKLLSISRDVS